MFSQAKLWFVNSRVAGNQIRPQVEAKFLQPRVNGNLPRSRIDDNFAGSPINRGDVFTFRPKRRAPA